MATDGSQGFQPRSAGRPGPQQVRHATVCKQFKARPHSSMLLRAGTSRAPRLIVVGCHRFRVSVWPCITCIAFLFLLNFTPPASAHTLDTSYARVAIGTAEVEFKFTCDLLTLARITKLDTDGDGAISRGELAAAPPAIQKFLRAHIYLELNQREAEFADAVMPAWPD